MGYYGACYRPPLLKSSIVEDPIAGFLLVKYTTWQ